jgi:urea transport system permease protein
VDLAVIVAIDFVYAIATLALISLGLAIVFGMMRIINLAHGEFMVMGSYSAAVAVHYGINIWLAILVVAPISVGIIGVILERLIIRHLYGRMVETMLATWGLSLFVVGILTMIFGDITEGVPTPLPGIRIGAYQTSGYSLFVIALAIATLFAVYVILRSSRLSGGLEAAGKPMYDVLKPGAASSRAFSERGLTPHCCNSSCGEFCFDRHEILQSLSFRLCPAPRFDDNALETAVACL